MTIKIDQNDPSLFRSGNNSQTQNNGRTAGADGAARGAETPGETVQLTSGARDAAEVARGLAAEPAFDAAKVERIRQSIEQGNYPVDSERLADAILKLDGELPGGDDGA